MKRICVIGCRSGKGGRDRLSGILRYSSQTPTWVVDLILVDTRDACSRLTTILTNTPPEAVILLTTEHRILSVLSEAAMRNPRRWHVLAIDIPDILLQGLHVDLALKLDDAEIARAAARLLIQRGHSNLAYVGYRQEREHSDVRENTLSALAWADGLPFSSFEARSRRTAAHNELLRLAEWLKTLPTPCGVIAYYDFLSRDIIDACRLARLEVPGQIAIIGVDNEISLCENTQPSLSSILPAFEESAFEAARELDALMNAHKRSGRTIRKTYGIKAIVERNSTVDLRGGGRLIAMACEFMRNHATESVSVSAVANYCRVSRRLLEIRAREILGKSVREYIEGVRMDNVRQLLSNTRLPLQEIAYRTGFKTQTYLAVRFKSLFGRSMSDYRKASAISPGIRTLTQLNRAATDLR